MHPKVCITCIQLQGLRCWHTVISFSVNKESEKLDQITLSEPLPLCECLYSEGYLNPIFWGTRIFTFEIIGVEMWRSILKATGISTLAKIKYDLSNIWVIRLWHNKSQLYFLFFRFADIFSRHMKWFLLTLFILGGGCFVVLALCLFGVIPDPKGKWYTILPQIPKIYSSG